MRKQKILFIFSVSFVFFAFFLLNSYTPRTMDDFNYAFKYTDSGRSSEKISSISDILTSQFHHYFIYNGRVLVHSFVQFFSSQKNDIFFNILNSIAVIILITLISVYLKMKTGYNKLYKIWLFSFLLFWFLVPSPSMTLMWKTGSINYLWTSVLIMGFLCLHHKASASSFSGKWWMPFLIITGILCGWGHEGLSIGFALGLIFYHIYNYKKISISAIYLVIGFLIGASIVIFSPGILVRADGLMPTSNTFAFVMKRLMAFYRMFFEGQTKGTLIIIIVMLVQFFKNKFILKEFISKNTLIFFCFISFLMFQLLTAFPGQARGAMGMELTAILLLLLYLIEIRSNISIKAQKIITPLLIIILLIDYSSALSSCIKNSASVKMLVSNYTNSKNGVVKSPFPEKFLNDRFLWYRYSSDPSYPQNVAFSNFYKGEKPLIVLNSGLYDQLYSGGDLFKKYNLIDPKSGFYTSPELDCYVAKQSFKNNNQKRNVKINCGFDSFFKVIKSKHIISLMDGVSGHYSKKTEAKPLNTEKGSYLLILKYNLPKRISAKEIMFID